MSPLRLDAELRRRLFGAAVFVGVVRHTGEPLTGLA